MASRPTHIVALGGSTTGVVARGVEAAVGVGRWPSHAPRTIAVLAIRGDGRIADSAETWLRHDSVVGPVGLVVIGDYVDGAGGGALIAGEAARLLAQRGVRVASPALLLDTPLMDLGRWIERWRIEVSQGAAAAPSPEPTVRRAPATGPDEEALHRLTGALGALPDLRYDERGRCMGVRLVSGGAYPRSLLEGVPHVRLKEVWASLGTLPMLRDLRVPYASLTSWPDDLSALGALARLDLRGNPIREWSFLTGFPDLTRLNASACRLGALPDPVRSLPELQELLIYKNALTALPEWVGGCTALARLSIYRNAVTSWAAPPGSYPALQTLNLGANPIRSLHVGVRSLLALEQLGLDRVPLGRVPASVVSLPSLRQISIRRSPLLGAELGTWGGTVVDSRCDHSCLGALEPE